ncbi:hypothetical protein Tco_0853178 [Tanacetum coccineum]
MYVINLHMILLYEFAICICTLNIYVCFHPSYGSDVNAGKKESMCVDVSVKTSCATDLNGNTFHSDSMDVDPDRKVVHQNEHDQHVSANNLKGAEKIAVETLLKIIDFDVPKESPIQPLMIESLVEGFKTGKTSKSSTTDPQSHMYVEECNDDKVRRDAKMSKYLLSPFMIPPESTQRVHKLRPRNKKTKKMAMRLTARDGKFIPEWTEAQKGVVGCLIRKWISSKRQKPSKYKLSIEWKKTVQNQAQSPKLSSQSQY